MEQIVEPAIPESEVYMENAEKIYFTMKQVVEITQLSVSLIRVYQNEFNLQIERSEGGHRRFTQKNIDDLLAIKEKIQDKGWTYNQVRDWLNGNVLIFEASIIKSNIENQVEELSKKVADQSELLMLLIEKLDQQSKVMDQQTKFMEKSLKEQVLQLPEPLQPQIQIAAAFEAPKRKRRRKTGFFERWFGSLL